MTTTTTLLFFANFVFVFVDIIERILSNMRKYQECCSRIDEDADAAVERAADVGKNTLPVVRKKEQQITTNKLRRSNKRDVQKKRKKKATPKKNGGPDC